MVLMIRCLYPVTSEQAGCIIVRETCCQVRSLCGKLAEWVYSKNKSLPVLAYTQ